MWGLWGGRADNEAILLTGEAPVARLPDKKRRLIAEWLAKRSWAGVAPLSGMGWLSVGVAWTRLQKKRPKSRILRDKMPLEQAMEAVPEKPRLIAQIPEVLGSLPLLKSLADCRTVQRLRKRA